MKNFYKEGRGLPFWLISYFNKLKSISTLFASKKKDLALGTLTSNHRESYAKYLASLIYEYQLRLKYSTGKQQQSNKAMKRQDDMGNVTVKLGEELNKILHLSLKPVSYGLLVMTSMLFSSVVVFAQHTGELTVFGANRSRNDSLSSMMHVAIVDQEKQRFMKISPKADLKKFPLKKYHIDSTFNRRAVIGKTIDAAILDLPIKILTVEGHILHTTLREFSNKDYLILDFWARWCSPCVVSMNHWEHLNESISSNIQVIGVHLDYDYKVPIETTARGWRLPQIIGPEAYLLNQYFLGVSAVGPSVWIKGNVFFGVSQAGLEDHSYVFKILDGTYNAIPPDALHILKNDHQQ